MANRKQRRGQEEPSPITVYLASMVVEAVVVEGALNFKEAYRRATQAAPKDWHELDVKIIDLGAIPGNRKEEVMALAHAGQLVKHALLEETIEEQLANAHNDQS